MDASIMVKHGVVFGVEDEGVAFVQTILMLTAILTAVVSPFWATVEIHPSDDVWAYPHASDQVSDPFLRVWGAEGQSVAKSAEESESLGYSFLRFDLAGLPDKALKGAELILTHPAKPTFTLEKAKANPLEVRPARADFSEKSWSYGDLAKFLPAAGKDSVYGTGSPEAVSDEKEFQVRIDLTKGPGGFLKAFESSRKSGGLGLALTSTMSPAEEARSTYKLYSRNGPKEFQPTLRLTFED